MLLYIPSEGYSESNNVLSCEGVVHLLKTKHPFSANDG
jgi:hypothetical protein